MRKMCANDAMPKKRKKKTVTPVDTDLGELQLNDDSSDSDEEMTAVAQLSFTWVENKLFESLKLHLNGLW